MAGSGIKYFLEKYPESKSTFAKISKDSAHKVSMLNEAWPVVDFDSVTKKFGKEINQKGIHSADGYFKYQGREVFVEFKNGYPKLADVMYKVYDSAIVFSMIKNKSPNYLKERGEFVLVYNAQKLENSLKSKAKLVSGISSRASKPVSTFLDPKVRGFLYKDIYECTVDEFIERYSECFKRGKGKKAIKGRTEN